MDTVALSPKFQVTIPHAVRAVLKLKAGQKFQVFTLGDHIKIIPVKPMKAMRGFLKGTDNNFDREG